MRILMVHNRYLHWGGEDTVFDDEVALLRGEGHEVTEWVVSNERITRIPRHRMFFRTTWSRESYTAALRSIDDVKPQIMHVHNLFPLHSPSILWAAKRRMLPVVLTLHNYRLLCLNALLFRNGSVCELCVGRRLAWPGVKYRCYRASRAASATVAAMLAAHRVLKTWDRCVDAYITLSEFAKQKLFEGGFLPDRVDVRPNFLHDPGKAEHERRSGAVFVGMLQQWKGVATLLESWKQCKSDETLTIVGSGPEEARLRAKAYGARVRFTGFIAGPSLISAVSAARFSVFPSTIYETFGRTIVESFACGTPVIGSRLGSAAELIREGETGLLFKPGDRNDLTCKLQWALDHPGDIRRMGENARLEYEQKYMTDIAYESLMRIYRKAINRAPSSRQ